MVYKTAGIFSYKNVFLNFKLHFFKTSIEALFSTCALPIISDKLSCKNPYFTQAFAASEAYPLPQYFLKNRKPKSTSFVSVSFFKPHQPINS